MYARHRLPVPAFQKPSMFHSSADLFWVLVLRDWRVLGLGGLYIILKHFFAPDAAINSEEMVRTVEVLTGFSLGAESIALFARVGGGIYTKAADVGADRKST